MGFIKGAELVYNSKSKSQDYHDEMNNYNYCKWLNEKLVPNLPAGCIVVFDNASYHTVQENKPPTSCSRIADIKEWLSINNIHFEPDSRKAELLQLVTANKPIPIYTADKILREKGFTVLRLPPYNCDLNPIELIWGILKQKVALNNVSGMTLPTLKVATMNAISEISQEQWVSACNHVKKLEEEYWRRDGLMDEEIDRLIIHFDSSDNSDGGDSCSATETAGSSTDTADEGAEEVFNMSEIQAIH